MKKYPCAVALLFATVGFAAAQSDPPAKKMQVVVSNPVIPARTPAPRPTPIIVGQPRIETEPAARPFVPPTPVVMEPRAVRVPARTLTFRETKSKIAEAKRAMQTRPLSTSLSGAVFEGVETVRIAFNDTTTNDVDYVVMTKEAFLSTEGEKIVRSESGKTLYTRTIRGNGVNTPITLVDEQGVAHLPLIVQYPRVDKGRYQETAYYISTHPGLVTPETVSAGRVYVRNVIEIAREKLRNHGITILPKIADIAERLTTVEHVDHLRFRTEEHPKIFNDVHTLFALNEGQTYRFAVSSAGAGGMVQMIPSTYRMVRTRFSNVPLNPVFMDGMRDHVNAVQAMLLYMQWTWEDLTSRPTINEALESGIATKDQIMAAGYNSNPARLSGYIDRAGANWRNLIPRETQMYLQIYAAVERHVPMPPRTR